MVGPTEARCVIPVTSNIKHYENFARCWDETKVEFQLITGAGALGEIPWSLPSIAQRICSVFYWLSLIVYNASGLCQHLVEGSIHAV
jgi:hypothetical protein